LYSACRRHFVRIPRQPAIGGIAAAPVQRRDKAGPDIGCAALGKSVDLVFGSDPKHPQGTQFRRHRIRARKIKCGDFGIERRIGHDLIETTVDGRHGDRDVGVARRGDLNNEHVGCR
jgi:hypothetical protein